MHRMKNILLLFFLLVFRISSLLSQRIIDVSYALDAKGNYQFSCTNNTFCTYILQVSFTKFDNAKTDQQLPYVEPVNPGFNKLFTISRENPNNPIEFKYSVGYLKGCPHANVKTNFVYVLPIAPGKEAQAYELDNSKNAPGNDPEARNWYVIRLRMKPGDTIYAARRGVVNEVLVTDSLNDLGSRTVVTENYIEIVHADCSFGRYGILRRNGALVKRGQTVEAGQPIGLVGGDKYGRGSDAKFSVYYYINDAPKPYRQYLDSLIFWTKNNGKGKLKHGANYICEAPPQILKQEIPAPAAKPKKPKPKTK